MPKGVSMPPPPPHPHLPLLVTRCHTDLDKVCYSPQKKSDPRAQGSPNQLRLEDGRTRTSTCRCKHEGGHCSAIIPLFSSQQGSKRHLNSSRFQ